MENFSAKKLESNLVNNGGYKFKNGDGVPANDINSIVEGILYNNENKDYVVEELDAISEVVNGINLLDISKIEKDTRFDDLGNIIVGGDAMTACITDFIPISSGCSLTFTYEQESGYRGWLQARRVIAFNENKKFIALVASRVSTCSVICEGVAYVRIQFTTALAENKGFVKYGDEWTSEYEPYEVKRVISQNSITAIGGSDFSFNAKKYFSDITIVNDCIWGFTESTDVGTMDGRICIYTVNANSKSGMFNGNAVKHNFGHCNTVDYCKETDCLVFGNGSGEYGVAEKFYVIPNAHQLTERTENDINTLGIEYDCSAYEYGDKLNVCWGYDNNGRHDIVVLITNDNKNIRFAQLGKGTNNLGLGTLVEGKGTDEFNGTFKIINEYTLDDGTTHPNNENCNQGSDYHNGKLYVAVGHEPHRHWEISFLPNGKTSFVEVCERIYSETGTAATGATEGMCITDNYMIYHLAMTCGGVYSETMFIKKR